MATPPRLLDQVRERLRLKHYSIRTEQAYVDWIKRFILFHRKRHPTAMGKPEVEAFLTHLAVVRNVADSTQNQALSAVLFLYKEVLGRCVNFRESHSRHDDQKVSWLLQRRVPPSAANRCTCPFRTRTVMLSPTSGTRSSETDAIMRLRPPSTSK